MLWYKENISFINIKFNWSEKSSHLVQSSTDALRSCIYTDKKEMKMEEGQISNLGESPNFRIF